MKVLQINAVYGNGSTGIIVKDIDTALQQRGYTSYVAYAKSTNAPQNGYKIGNLIDQKLHAVLARLIGKQAYFSFFCTNRLLNFIDKIKPDIIHLHNLHSNYINLKMLTNYINKNNINTVITLHDCWFFTGKCFHYGVVGCNKWQTRCGNCPRVKEDVPSWFFDQTTRVFEDKKRYMGLIPNLVVVGVSNWISNEAKKSFFQSKKIVTIQNGVDLEIFKPTESDIRKKLNVEEKFVILGMANKWLDKINQSTFSYVVNQLCEDEVLVLLGCRKDQIEHLPNNVIGLEYCSKRNDLAKIYSLSDIFVNVTREDSLPTVNIEAICCGTPVITFDSGGSSEIIDNNTGLVVAQGDDKALLMAIKKIKKKGKQHYQNKCREHGVKNFNKDDRYIDYINLYEKIIENHIES